MRSPDVDAEKQVQFERDEVAFNALSPGQQRQANGVAAAAFRLRWAVAGIVKAVIFIVGAVVEVLLKDPYILLKYVAVGLANGAVRGVEFGVRGIAAVAHGLLAFDKTDRGAAWRKTVLDWKENTIEKIDRAWREKKENLRRGVQKAADFIEHYGALGLYRTAAWIFNPRLPSGKPLLGNETANKVAGIAAAACAFVVLAGAIAKVKVVGLMLHGKVAHLRLSQQLLLHPLIMASVSAIEFTAFPVIAAARQALKSTHFTQGIAYQYNVRLRERRQEKNAARPASTRRISSLAKAVVGHIIEKASPEFYKVRLAHYRAKARAAAPAIQLRAPDGGSGGAPDQRELTKEFNDNRPPASPEVSRRNPAPKKNM